MNTEYPTSAGSANPVSPGQSPGWRGDLLARYLWLGFVLPLAVFLVVTSFEPTPPASVEAQPDVPHQEAPQDQTSEPAGWFGIEIPYRAYPLIYTLKIALSIVAVVFVWPTYRQFPWKLSPLAIVAGVVGVVLWVGICHLHLEARVLPALGLQSLLDTGQRSAFNPLAELAGQPAWAYGFLVVRFVGLALLVPLIEEFFLRGFLMRVCVQEDWERVPFGTVNMLAVIAGTAVPMLMHPGELLAALVWFTMITGLMVKTRNIWDCVVAHATTNLLLGVYAVVWNQWQLL